MSASADTLRRTIRVWEKQRILYTVFIASFLAWRFGQFPFWSDSGPNLGRWFEYLLMIAIANAFYCLGPLFAIYTLLLTGIECERGRILFFGLGVLFSAALLAMAY